MGSEWGAAVGTVGWGGEEVCFVGTEWYGAESPVAGGLMQPSQDGGDASVPTPHPHHPRPYGYGGRYDPAQFGYGGAMGASPGRIRRGDVSRPRTDTVSMGTRGDSSLRSE